MIAGVYDVSEITPSLISNLLKELGDFTRKVAITIKNLSPGIVFEKPEVYIQYGKSNFLLPISELSSNKGLVWGARKVASVTAGTVGVIVYHLKNRNESLAFMWSVPFNYAFYSNWWNLKVYKGRVKANQGKNSRARSSSIINFTIFNIMINGLELYDKMYNELPHKGDNNVYRGVLNDDLLYTGSMGESGTPTIKVEILNYTTISTTPFVKEMKRNL
ncbi:16553_t:CDS:2 [Funneliformis geosporum]|uniref:7605_t:CDS:1 n=1 Tax=Funneliformis geosporum TaxID=1117311 RepID=A0A9W4T2Q6_9GLOM|nr:16553_t:CDS:2 [Funneliformis geosporum]CAI2192353.1 7605_t:CDS:2 [Funneliformis geosporum]